MSTPVPGEDVSAGVSVMVAAGADTLAVGVGEAVGVVVEPACELVVFGKMSQKPRATSTSTMTAKTALFWPGLRSTAPARYLSRRIGRSQNGRAGASSGLPP